jgi:hypothetical protein
VYDTNGGKKDEVFFAVVVVLPLGMRANRKKAKDERKSIAEKKNQLKKNRIKDKEEAQKIDILLPDTRQPSAVDGFH